MHLMSLAPPEARSHTPKIVLSGRDEVLIERHRGLFSYETKCVRVRAGTGVITVTGEGLVIVFFGTDDLKIRGRIDGIGLYEETR